MGAVVVGINVLGARNTNPNEMNFGALYSEEVNFIENQGGGYHSN